MKTQIMLFANLLFVPTMFLLLLNSVEAADDVRCRESDRQVLLEFKAGVVDDFGILSSWGNNSKECCNWRGIRCSNRTHHVTLLNLPGYFNDDRHIYIKLRGKISPSLSELKHLKYLNLSYNGFDGEISPQLGNLTNLRSLDLARNYGMDAQNLEWVSRLHLLTHLDLSRVNLSNCNDWLNQIYKLSSLTHLHLRRCHLPDQFGPLINTSFPPFNSLVFVDLSQNNFISPKSYNWLFNFTTTLVSLDLSLVNLSSCNDWLNQIYKLSSLTHLYLSECSLPDQFGSLINTSFPAFNSLVVANLSYNHFISPKSYNWLFNFTTTLVSLDLTYTSFPRNEIPEAIGRIVSLESLYLAGSELVGMLPDSFMNLTRLATLDLSQNNFNGSLSELLHPLATKENNSLQVIKLDHNQLDGSLPDYFTRFPSLREMLISRNNLNGSFPDNFWQLYSSLVHLDLSNNQLTGPFPNLTLFSSLEILTLYNNELEGTVPETYLSHLSNLIYLDLSYNSLSFNFSVDWFPSFKLDRILFKNCTLGPYFPNWIKSQRNFFVLDISHAGISDTIPLWFWDLSPRLASLDMSNNQIKGVLPNISLAFPDIHWMDLSYNLLQGSIPPLPLHLFFLDLSHNMFTGSLSLICSSLVNLQFLDLSDNKLSGELSADCFMNNDLLALNLANNGFSGNIPTSIWELDSLQYLLLRNNSFTGQIPLSLMNITELLLLDLSENKLNGEVPTWIGTHLTKLKVLSLRINEFFGSIPPQICHLRYAHVLDLSRNNLTGSIPHCVSNLTSLVEKVDDVYALGFNSPDFHPNAVVQWKRVGSEYKLTLRYLKLIDLSSNRLVGEIPEEFGSFKELLSLNLSRNCLTGNIIPEIGQMANLDSLDLSRNHLSGEIPSSLASLTLLSVLDLSNNNLSGRIPLSTQLQSFNASDFAGNERLCGLPLPNKCGPISLPTGDDNGENNGEDAAKFPKFWLYVSVVLGFGTGFWGFIGPLILRRTWRHSYYKWLGNTTDWMCITATLHVTRLRRKFYG